MKHVSFQEFLLHTEQINFLKVAFPAHMGTGMKWQREDWLYSARKKTQQVLPARGTLYVWSASPPPAPAPYPCHLLGVQAAVLSLCGGHFFFFLNKKKVCISIGFACSAIFCDQRIETAASPSSLAIKPAVDRLCPNPTATGKVQPQI